jgi:hypothetical protein
MLLKVVVEPARGASDAAVRLELFGVEQACMIAWTSAPLTVGLEDAAAAEGVAKLLSGLKVAPQPPSR